MAEIFAVETRGVGKPDYSREISAGQERAGIRLKYGQRLMSLVATFTDQVIVPYINPTVLAPLAGGASSRLIDPETGLAGPITVPAGYISMLVQYEWDGDQDIEMWYYIDTILAGCPGISGSGANVGYNMVIPPSTEWWDPVGASAHAWDVVVINRGLSQFEGTVDFILLLDPVGTEPLPTTKVCKCPFCKHEQVMPVETTFVKCNQCGQQYILRDLSRFRGAP